MTETALAVWARFVLGVAAAVIATLAMDRVMALRPEGETPPRVAAGVLTDRRPGAAPQRPATVVHYLAGGLTGPLFVWLLYGVEGLLGAGLLAVVVATLILYPLMVGFFVLVVLPRSSLPRQRIDGVRRDWAVSAAAYLAVLVPLVAVGSALL